MNDKQHRNKMERNQGSSLHTEVVPGALKKRYNALSAKWRESFKGRVKSVKSIFIPEQVHLYYNLDQYNASTKTMDPKMWEVLNKALRAAYCKSRSENGKAAVTKVSENRFCFGKLSRVIYF